MTESHHQEHLANRFEHNLAGRQQPRTTSVPRDSTTHQDDSFAADGVSGTGLASNYIFLAVGEVIAKLLTFGAFTYLGRTFGPQQYGTLELALAIMVFFALPVDLGLGIYGAREVAKNRRRAHDLLRDVATLRLLLACCSFAALLVLTALIDASAEVKLLLCIFGLSLFAAPAMLEWLFQGHDLMHWVAVASIVRRGTFAGLVFLFVRLGTPIYWIAVFECISVAAVAVVGLTILRQGLKLKFPRLRFRPNLLQSRLRSSAPIGLSELAWAFLWYFPTVQLGFLIAGESLGWFGAAHRAVMALHTFVWLYLFNLLPSLSRCAGQPKENLQDLMRRSLAPAAWTSIFVALFTALLSRHLLVLAYGPEFGGGARVISILIWLIPVAMLSGHYRYNLIAHDLQRLELVCTIVAAVVCVALGWVLTPHFGAVGTASALLSANLVNFALAYYFAERHVAHVALCRHLAMPLLATLLALAMFLFIFGYHHLLATAVAAATYLCLFALCQRHEIVQLCTPAVK